jgi:FkbM family methyltransferase
MDELDDLTRQKLSKLAAAREETEAEVLARFGVDVLRTRCPKSISRQIKRLRGCELEASGVSDDGWAWVRIPSGRVFYSPISQSNHQSQFELTKDLLPDCLTAETFLAGLDVAQRYLSDYSWLPDEVLPPAGGTVIECGAYLGHKSVRFVDDAVGGDGKVLAVEMMPQNVSILRKNIEVNHMQGVIDVMEAGVWDRDSKLEVAGKGRQRYSIANLDKLNDSPTDTVVDTLSLDTIIERWGQPRVDLLYITINGAEIEAVRGLNEMRDRVQTVVIVAPYTRAGEPTAPVCRELLIEKGFRVDDTIGRDTYIIAHRDKA